jgi:IS605 OrfB family transposase
VKGTATRPPTLEERRERRILLALSWLTVEDARGAPTDETLIVARGTDTADGRMRKLADALDNILAARGVQAPERGDPDRLLQDQIGTWLGDCMASLGAAIREDAVWVNRSRAYDIAARQLSITREEIWDFLEPFFSSIDSYLASESTDFDQDETIRATTEDKAKDLVQKAGGWLSKRFGTGVGANFTKMAEVYSAMCNWACEQESFESGPLALDSLANSLKSFSPASYDTKGILKLISGPGYDSGTRKIIAAWEEAHSPIDTEAIRKFADKAATDFQKCNSKTGGKGRRAYSDTILNAVEAVCGFTYLQDLGSARHAEYSVILDHAARRVNVAHSWIKNAESDRRQFENDASRIEQVPTSALVWLRNYCAIRGMSSGAVETYRLRRRAIDAWDKVVDRWSRPTCKTTEDRIFEARQLQDDPEIEKFGDIQLFEALAGEDAVCVWKSGDSLNPQPLKDFVAASEALANKQRFKVPAYRHPDALRNPVFVDFGNSRWQIDYSAHRAAVKLAELRANLEIQNGNISAIREKLTQATEGRRSALEKRLEEAVAKQQKVKADFDELSDPHRLQLKLWTGRTIDTVPLHWSSKRLISDLAIRPSLLFSDEKTVGVSRADRLGRAATAMGLDSVPRILGLFEQSDWNGRLQAPRQQLDSIARHIDKYGWDAKARRLVDQVRWLVSFSAKLTQQGPWTTYSRLFDETAKARPFVSRKGEYAVKHDSNDSRQGHSKLMLSRLPGMRVLAVDLGHRYAAACAVWEAISIEQIESECDAAGVASPDAQAMFMHLAQRNAQGKPKSTVFRRIGSDRLPDGTPHPAPWARLDRQFLIKLQGEDRPARAASAEEVRHVEEFETWVGFHRDEAAVPRKRGVDQLMGEAVRTARLALARHGRRARIAFQWLSNVRILPGGRRQSLDEPGETELLTDMLVDWHALATDARWSDSPALDLWNSSIAKLEGGFEIDSTVTRQLHSLDRTRAARRQEEQVLRRQLAPVAAQLQRDRDLRQELNLAWTQRWTADDEQWRRYLKWLARWLLPRGGLRRDGGRRRVGGLSLTRISTLTELRRKVQVAYFTRMRPDGRCTEIDRFFGQATLDAIQRLKDQRIKQLASRIVEAALGVGSEKMSANGRDLPRQPSGGSDRRFAPCHSIVIEDLSHYRPEETRTRRENRNTMDWKSAETRKRLADHCQLYGLYLRDVNPQYTSRQDSRTGAPGLRCVDVPMNDFLSQPWWRKQVLQAKNKLVEKKGDARDRYLLALEQRWATASEVEKRKIGSLRIPMHGGELFISSNPQSPLARGIQADLNAAANIGLRALIDPDFPGKWWYVPCDPATKQPHPEKVKGSILCGIGPLAPVVANDSSRELPSRRKRSNKSSRDKVVVNLWRDPQAMPIEGIQGVETWFETSAYWNLVKLRVATLLFESGNFDGKELSAGSETA